MGIYKTLNPEDVSLRSFQVNKKFTFTNNDSGSEVYGLRAISGSNYNFKTNSSSTISQSFGEHIHDYLETILKQQDLTEVNKGGLQRGRLATGAARKKKRRGGRYYY